MELTHVSLCTGIGGFEEGAEKAGFTNIAMCEINAKCRQYLSARFPDSKIYTDVITDPPKEKSKVLSFGFPCQDISNSGKGAGIFGERSRLFFNCMDVVRANRPDYIVIENSPVLLTRGMGHVLNEISGAGYYAEWACFSGSQFAYPIRRKRLFIVAFAVRNGRRHPILRPPGTFKISQSWAPGKTFVHVSAERANGFRNTSAICRGDRVPHWKFWLHAIGNMVMPPVAEHVFHCIRQDIVHANL